MFGRIIQFVESVKTGLSLLKGHLKGHYHAKFEVHRSKLGKNLRARSIDRIPE